MHKPDPVETILARLMPPAMSDEAQRGIEAMLDELGGTAEESVAIPKPPGMARSRRMIGGGIAAAGVAAAMVISLVFRSNTAPTVAMNSDGETRASMVLMGESDRIESMTDEGWQEDSDGSAVHALRFKVVEENSLLDEETGIVMQVSEPREEIFLMPVSAF